MPAVVSPLTVSVAVLAFTRVAAAPPTCVHAYVVTVPSASLAEPLIVVVVTGSVMVLFVPALATGAWLAISG